MEEIEESELALRKSFESSDRMPNNLPLRNEGGHDATFSVEGFVDLENDFHKPQGTNGRHCATCHLPEAGWSIRPDNVQRMFDETGGTHPIFNIIDANTPSSDVSTVEARRSSYSMLLQGKFIRIRRPPASREYDVIAASDPFGFGTTSQLLFFRRPLPTANFRSHSVMWDGANTVGTDLRAGLVRQARGNVTGAQQGPPAPDSVINAIVDYEMGLSHAQIVVPGVGRLDSDGARGGPEAQASQPLVAGRFDLFDAWIGHSNPRRAQIARGQEIFNNVNAPSGRRCGACHNAANNGQNVNGTLFNIGASAASRRKPDMAVYTLRNRTTGEIVETTDPGRAIVSGRWSDVNRFKTPNIRGLASRAPFFHNGIAATLEEVVRLYEEALGFVYTAQEREDLVAFLNAL
jgi:hypothetical protein